MPRCDKQSNVLAVLAAAVEPDGVYTYALPVSL